MIRRLALVASLLAGVLAPPCVARAQAAGRSIALVLDASGSMKAKLASGQTRMDAAKDAVARLVGGLPGDLRLAFRAYGHQHPTSAKDCRDTELLTAFQPIDRNRAEVVSLAHGLEARGYTPISHVLELAANDLEPETSASSRVVILVSDGKETCEGDPCAAARALARANADLVIHTIGFAVDAAARYQLQCIARVGRGTYFEADSVGALGESLAKAVETAAVQAPAEVRTKSTTPGRLRLTNPTASSHEVIRVDTGEVATKLSAVRSSVELPAGFYNVRFGDELWRSIEVRDGEVAEITSAIVALPGASFRGHEIRDAETGQPIAKLSSSGASMNLLPSSYTISFGKKTVPFTLEPGKTTTIEAAVVTFQGLSIQSRTIRDEAGAEVIDVSSTTASAVLPPGRYVLDLGGTTVPFEVRSGQPLALDVRPAAG